MHMNRFPSPFLLATLLAGCAAPVGEPAPGSADEELRPIGEIRTDPPAYTALTFYSEARFWGDRVAVTLPYDGRSSGSGTFRDELRPLRRRISSVRMRCGEHPAAARLFDGRGRHVSVGCVANGTTSVNLHEVETHPQVPGDSGTYHFGDRVTEAYVAFHRYNVFADAQFLDAAGHTSEGTVVFHRWAGVEGATARLRTITFPREGHVTSYLKLVPAAAVNPCRSSTAGYVLVGGDSMFPSDIDDVYGSRDVAGDFQFFGCGYNLRYPHAGTAVRFTFSVR